MFWIRTTLTLSSTTGLWEAIVDSGPGPIGKVIGQEHL